MPVDVEAAGVDVLLAARSGDVQVVRSLVQRPGTNLEARDILGDTALLKAARYGHTEVVESLLFAGADANAQDNNGWTSLHVSIANNREHVFFALLSYRGQQTASFHIEVGGLKSRPPVVTRSTAYLLYGWQCVRLIGTDSVSQAANSNGDTPLHMAAYHGQEWAVEPLLRLGAELRATNEKGERPFQIARLNTIRAMLTPLPTTREMGAASTRDLGAEGGVGRPWDNESENATDTHKSSVDKKFSSSFSEARSIDVQRGGSHCRSGQESERLFSGAKPSGVDTGREGRHLISERHHGNARLLTNERSNGGIADDEGGDRWVSGSLISSLIPTETAGEGSYSSHERSGGDFSFEEVSSEGEESQENEGGTGWRC